MFEALVNIYRDITGDYDTDIQMNTKIKGGLSLSSLGIAQFICEIEDRFDIEISAQDIKTFKTVKNIVDYLEEKTK